MVEFKAPEENMLKPPEIVVVGVGGAGGNAVNNMMQSQLPVKFIVVNTDMQALENSSCSTKIQIGAECTGGLGAGAAPEVGEKAALESEEDIRAALAGSNMVFIAAGMGGGTGTGASPTVARIAKELGILVVGVVTMPFLFEGTNRMKVAEEGIRKLQKNVDTLIIIQNQNLFRIASENTSLREAFQLADEVLNQGVSGITHLITSPGLINLDFADIRTIMSDMGRAMMGTGEAGGEERAIKAAEAAVANPLLHHGSLEGAGAVIINITGGKDMTLYEVTHAADFIREKVGNPEANIIFGSTFDPNLEGSIKISVVATGIETDIDDFKAEEVTSQEETVAEDDDIVIDAVSEDNNDYTEELDGIATSEEEMLDEESLQQMQPKYDEYEEFAESAASRQVELEEEERLADRQLVQAEQDKQVELVTEGVAATANNVSGRQKKSFFSRMLSSIIASEPRESYDNVQDAQSHDSGLDIRNKPSFLNKDQ